MSRYNKNISIYNKLNEYQFRTIFNEVTLPKNKFGAYFYVEHFANFIAIKYNLKILVAKNRRNWRRRK